LVIPLRLVGSIYLLRGPSPDRFEGYNLILLGFNNFADGVDVHGALILGQLVDQAPPMVSFVLLLNFSSKNCFL
jgi:hypothetical protein